ncbi:RDD family protein [Microlunatus sp. Y2014]|uniref:RDD family protein n=1 Tax=Microlunatus sp. Y2014 TaxID=3418488 RepID=UPI003DA77B99
MSTQIVTGDAVLLDVRPARVPTRMFSALVDLAVVALGNYGWVVVLGLFREGSNAQFGAVQLIGHILVSLTYPIATETLTRGRTLGAFALGLRVTRDDGGVIRFRHALIRWLTFWAFDFAVWTGLMGGLICAALNPHGKRLGDVLAGTIVIRTRAPRSPRPLPDVPDEFADWAGRLELGRIPADLLNAARHFVQRRENLLPHPRRTIAEDLAAKIYARTSPPPPHEMPPEDYLAVVVAERRRRETERVNRRQWVPTAEELPAGWR